MLDTSSEQPSASSVIVVSNTSSYHTNGSDVINAAFSEAFGSVCDASYYFKNLIDFHQSHFHHLHKHHVFNLNLNVKSTSTDSTSTEAAPLANTTNLSPAAGNKRKQELKQNQMEANLVSLRLDGRDLDENLNVKRRRGRPKPSRPCALSVVHKLVVRKYKRLARRRAPVPRPPRPSRFKRVRRAPPPQADTLAPPQPPIDTYVSYQAGYYYSSDADPHHSHFYDEHNTALYQAVPARALNHDLLKLSYDKFKQFRLNEKLLQQTVLIRNAIKLLQYELQYQHEQEIQQQQFIYQQQQQQQQQQMMMEYGHQGGYQHSLVSMSPSGYETCADEVISRPVQHHVQTTSYFVNDVNRAEDEDNCVHNQLNQTDNNTTTNTNNHNTQTVNNQLNVESSYF